MLLAADVTFLGLPSVDSGHPTRTPTQVATYISIVTCIGSVVTGLLLLRQRRTRLRDSADEVVSSSSGPTYLSLRLLQLGSPQDKYLQKRRHKALGFETIAILYSLPYSLLLWS